MSWSRRFLARTAFLKVRAFLSCQRLYTTAPRQILGMTCSGTLRFHVLPAQVMKASQDVAGMVTPNLCWIPCQWKPIRCSNCSTFGHDCNRVANLRPGFGAHRMNPNQSYRPTPNIDHHNRDREGVWQVVQRKDKVKKTVQGVGMDVSLRVPTQAFEATNRGKCQMNQAPKRGLSHNSEGCGASSSEHVLYSITDSPSTCENRTSAVPINNSFNGLIPYVYERDDDGPIDGCVGGPLKEGNHEEDDTDEKFQEAVEAMDVSTPISARQMKKEAKLLFSGSRPKGRHRS